MEDAYIHSLQMRLAEARARAHRLMTVAAIAVLFALACLIAMLDMASP